jgi:hypothetical protein
VTTAGHSEVEVLDALGLARRGFLIWSPRRDSELDAERLRRVVDPPAHREHVADALVADQPNGDLQVDGRVRFHVRPVLFGRCAFGSRSGRRERREQECGRESGHEAEYG